MCLGIALVDRVNDGRHTRLKAFGVGIAYVEIDFCRATLQQLLDERPPDPAIGDGNQASEPSIFTSTSR